MSSITELNEQFGAIKAQYDAALKELQESDGMRDAFRSFFQSNPDIKALFWRQYVPYFNDGDPCEFSVNELLWADSMADLDPDHWNYSSPDDEVGWEYLTRLSSEVRWDQATRSQVPNPDYRPEVGDLAYFIYTNADLMEQLFGTHATVLVTPEKITVTEWVDHD